MTSYESSNPSEGLEERKISLPNWRSFFDVLNGQLDEATKLVSDELQNFLTDDAKGSFSTPEEKISFADALRHLLNRLQLRVKCEKCGEPAILEAKKSFDRGVNFTFRHPNVTYHLVQAKLPNLELVQKPVHKKDKLAHREERHGESGK
jgi:hypothetical protein